MSTREHWHYRYIYRAGAWVDADLQQAAQEGDVVGPLLLASVPERKRTLDARGIAPVAFVFLVEGVFGSIARGSRGGTGAPGRWGGEELQARGGISRHAGPSSVQRFVQRSVVAAFLLCCLRVCGACREQDMGPRTRSLLKPLPAKRVVITGLPRRSPRCCTLHVPVPSNNTREISPYTMHDHASVRTSMGCQVHVNAANTAPPGRSSPTSRRRPAPSPSPSPP